MEITLKRYREIKHKAKCCFEFFGTRNPLIILKGFEIQYSIIPINGNELKGFTHINKKHIPWVYISDKYDNFSTQIIAAHELGHILLHSSCSINMFEDDGKSSITEYEANIFLVELIPLVFPKGNYLKLTPEQLKYYICSQILPKHK